MQVAVFLVGSGLPEAAIRRTAVIIDVTVLCYNCREQLLIDLARREFFLVAEADIERLYELIVYGVVMRVCKRGG